MAKSGRSSTRKANNRRLASTVFGPAETARAERLSAKLLEVAQQPKPTTSDAEMDGIYGIRQKIAEILLTWLLKQKSSMWLRMRTNPATVLVSNQQKETLLENLANKSQAMDVDRKVSSNRNNRKIIGKRKQKKASIVFPKYSDRLKAKKNKKKA